MLLPLNKDFSAGLIPMEAPVPMPNVQVFCAGLFCAVTDVAVNKQRRHTALNETGNGIMEDGFNGWS